MHGMPTLRKRTAESWPQETTHAEQNSPSQRLIEPRARSAGKALLALRAMFPQANSGASRTPAIRLLASPLPAENRRATEPPAARTSGSTQFFRRSLGQR